MSVQVWTKVWAESKHSGSRLLMLLAIADFADASGVAYPSVETLATKTRMTPRNANLILSALTKSGELAIAYNEGKRGANLYRIRLDGCGRAGCDSTPEERFIPPEASFTSPEAPFTLKPASPIPEAGFPKPLKPASPEPSLNRQEPSRASAPPVAPTSRATKNRQDDSVEFDALWQIYPKKVAKADAAKAYSKLKPDAVLQAKLLQAVKSQAASPGWTKDGGRYVPHLATWLNSQRWEDEAGGSLAGADVFAGCR